MVFYVMLIFMQGFNEAYFIMVECSTPCVEDLGNFIGIPFLCAILLDIGLNR